MTYWGLNEDNEYALFPLLGPGRLPQKQEGSWEIVGQDEARRTPFICALSHLTCPLPSSALTSANIYSLNESFTAILCSSDPVCVRGFLSFSALPWQRKDVS